MKTIKSTIAPNPKEATHWVDLSADPQGGVTKQFDGVQWVEAIRISPRNQVNDDDRILKLQEANIDLYQRLNKAWEQIHKLQAKVRRLSEIITQQPKVTE